MSVLPVTGSIGPGGDFDTGNAKQFDHKAYAASYTHDGEVGQAGYYKVRLTSYGGIDAEATARTRAAAERYTFSQRSGDGHVLVNGRKLNVPSYHCKPGDKIKIGPKPSSQQMGLRMMDLTQAIPLKDWLALDRETMEGVVARLPEVEDSDPLVNVQLIVELYSR